MLALLLSAGLGCESDSTVDTGCPHGDLCALHMTLVIIGRLEVASSPVPGAYVTTTAFAGACGDTLVPFIPHPAIDYTDSGGNFTIYMEPLRSVKPACLRFASTDPAVSFDVGGVTLRAPPAPVETLTVNLNAP